MGEDRLIPRTMASQHPDNANIPSWGISEVIAGEDEVYEAYYDYAVLGCQEVMWDAEGKDIDPQVVRKLLSKYRDYFNTKKLGEDIFLTLRLPNPSIETSEKKVFIETLESIPKHNDVAAAFYGDPSKEYVFEVIFPFTKTHLDILRVEESYRKAVVQPFDERIDYQGLKLKEFVGEVHPREIKVIPLLEDMESLLACDQIISRYIEIASPSYMRVFIARSDPALNYGFTSAVLLAKLSLSKLRRVEERFGIPIYPIIGAGTLPFRGHNSPDNIEGFLEEYRGVWTVTIQSAFRYDHEEEKVVEAIRRLNNVLPIGRAEDLTEVEEPIQRIIQKLSLRYQESLELCIDAVNYVATLIPSRRSRKLHIGLYGYSRRVVGKSLPRAIPFTGAFYSLGMPPEFIGLRALKNLSEEEFDVLMEAHKRFREDLYQAGRRVVLESISLLSDYREKLSRKLSLEFLQSFIPLYLEDLETVSSIFGIRVGAKTLSDRRYANIVENFTISLIEEEYDKARDELVEAAKMRRAIG
ncbi:MAG: phosphoenolpyruvate carboxylase [Aigarchaeota archaeon]|nr:phosphoenolpyruvate carboxylase [Aigarchaeota archaeon]MCX8193425.1 phosphoenolpyruvate carboxylase [Nitrososphaeria archaeon]MDW7985843.1 phosphoenolpyruvate carboxylase [Nitrososphaerota archaeon]